MPSNPLEAYKSVEKATLSGRELEASVLSRAANMLADIQQNWDAPDRSDKLDEALRFTQRIWTFFQAELMDEANPLPRDIKVNVLTLSSFVDRRLFELMAAPKREGLEMLIRINRNIAAGLRGDSGIEPGNAP